MPVYKVFSPALHWGQFKNQDRNTHLLTFMDPRILHIRDWVICAFLQLCSTQDRAVGSLRLRDGWQSRQWPCANPSPRMLHCHEPLKDSFSSFLQPLQSLGKPGVLSSAPLTRAMLWWSRQWDAAGGRTLHNSTVINITVSHVFRLYEMELHEGLLLRKETF